MKKQIALKMEDETILKIKQTQENTSKFIRQSVNLRINPSVERQYFYDKAGGFCQYCLVELKDDFHIDHIIPISLGGIDSECNIAVVCSDCNLKKSNFLSAESEQIKSKKNFLVLGENIESVNDGYFNIKEAEKLIMVAAAKHGIIAGKFAGYSRKNNDFIILCYNKNIMPVVFIDGLPHMHLLVMVEYFIYEMKQFKHEVYKDIYHGDLFIENKNVFNKIQQ